MRSDPCKMIVGDGTVIAAAPHGRVVRAEVVDDGFCITAGRVRDTFPATARGLTAAAARLSDVARRGKGRRAPTAELFARDAIALHAGSLSRLTRLLWRLWAARAVEREPACAPLLALRRVRQALVFCGTPAFLRAPFLLHDALRFRAARAVFFDVARAADLTSSTWDASSAAQRLHLAARWRHLLCAGAPARVPRALHVTLEHLNVAEHPLADDALDPLAPVVAPARERFAAADTGNDDDVDADVDADVDTDDARLDRALCALRLVPLVCPLTSVRQLLLVTAFARASRPEERTCLAPRSALLQRADIDDLDDALDIYARGRGRRRDDPILPVLLGRHLARDTQLPRAGGIAALARRTVAPPARRRAPTREEATRTPPVPLPVARGLRFLTSTADVVAEAERMHHCVDILAHDAVIGRVFLFHVEHAGTSATVAVDARGRVTQARGPANTDNVAVDVGRSALARWGLGFALGALLDALAGDVPPATAAPARDDALRAVCAAGWPPTTSWDQPLRTRGELRAALVHVDATRGAVWSFLRRHLPKCLRGEAWLALRIRPDGVTRLVLLDRTGRTRAAVGRPADAQAAHEDPSGTTTPRIPPAPPSSAPSPSSSSRSSSSSAPSSAASPSPSSSSTSPLPSTPCSTLASALDD